MRNKIIKIVKDNFDAPDSFSVEQDLREYVLDSIDIGELVAIVNQEFRIKLALKDLQEVYCVNDLVDVIQNSYPYTA